MKRVLILLSLIISIALISGCTKTPEGDYSRNKCFTMDMIKEYRRSGNNIIVVEGDVYNMTGRNFTGRCNYTFYMKEEVPSSELVDRIGELCKDNLRRIDYEFSIAISPDLRKFVSKVINETIYELKEEGMEEPTPDHDCWHLVTRGNIVNIDTDEDICSHDLVMTTKKSDLSLMEKCNMDIFVTGEGNVSEIYMAKNGKENEFCEHFIIELNKVEGYERVQRYEL